MLLLVSSSAIFKVLFGEAQFLAKLKHALVYPYAVLYTGGSFL